MTINRKVLLKSTIILSNLEKTKELEKIETLPIYKDYLGYYTLKISHRLHLLHQKFPIEINNRSPMILY